MPLRRRTINSSITGCVLACLLCLAATNAGALPRGTLRFEHFGPENGLPHNTVNDILQDRIGYLWLATDGGLSRYDGYGFSNYRLDPLSGFSNVVMALLETSDGTLWVGTDSGLWQFDRASSTFSPVRFGDGATPAGYTQALLEDRSGGRWAGIGATIFHTPAGEPALHPFAIEGPAFERVWELAEDAEGSVWAMVGDARGLHPELRRITGDGWAGAPVGRSFSTFLFVDSARTLWSGPLKEPPATDSPALRSPPESVAAETYVNAVAESGDEETGDSLWLGSAAGLFRFDPATGRTVRHPLRPASPSWQSEQVRSLLVDRAGGLWVGTLGGLFHHDPYAKAFRQWRHDPQDPTSLSADPISDIVPGPGGRLWIGTFGGGLNRVDPSDGTCRRFGSESLPGDIVWSLMWQDEHLWIGAGPPTILDPRRDTFRTIPSSDLLPASANQDASAPLVSARSQVFDARGQVWLGTFHHGLFVKRLDGSWHRFPDLLTSHMTSADGETLWIGHEGSVTRLDTVSEQIERFPLVSSAGRRLESVEVFDILVDPGAGPVAGLWLATSAGLGRLEPGERAVRLPVAAEELPGTVVFSIQPDEHHRLWLGTNQGLARFDPAGSPGERVRAFGYSEGLGNVEFNRHSRYRAADGTLYLGGMNGVTIFHPDDLRDNPIIPPVVLTQVRVVGGDGEIRHAGEGLSRLELPAGTTEVTFHFTALGFTRAERNRYRYRLDGFDADWIDGGTDRFARYTNVPPGNYSFHVLAANNDGVWNETGLSLPVVAYAPFWRTGWFRSLALLALAGALALAYRLRVRRLIELERVRLRIAGDLHDELGSDLSGIALATARLAGRDDFHDADRLRLQEVQSASVQVMQGLRDIVWYVNPDHDRLGALEARMRSAARLLLAGIEHRFEVDLPLPRQERALAMEARRDLFLIFKELLTNAARHSGAQLVEIRLAADDEGILLEVEDDGRGFHPEAGLDGSGLASSRRRADRLGAHFDIGPREGGGTRARLRLPGR